MRAFLFESLATLGVVDVAYVYPDGLWPELGDRWGTDDLAFCSRYDGLLYLRLNAWGAHCLGLTDAYAAPAAERQNLFKILPNREIVLMGSQEPSLADLSFLGQFALQKGEFVWELDAHRPSSRNEKIRSAFRGSASCRFRQEQEILQIGDAEVGLSPSVGKIAGRFFSSRFYLIPYFRFSGRSFPPRHLNVPSWRTIVQ
jgi:hypothetical protein